MSTHRELTSWLQFIHLDLVTPSYDIVSGPFLVINWGLNRTDGSRAKRDYSIYAKAFRGLKFSAEALISAGILYHRRVTHDWNGNFLQQSMVDIANFAKLLCTDPLLLLQMTLIYYKGNLFSHYYSVNLFCSVLYFFIDLPR